MRQVADWSIGEGIGAAPIVWNDIVYVGKAGGDWGIKGRMMAFNVADGSLAWSFDLIPTGSQTGARDLGEAPGSAEHGGGAAWTSYALDRETGTLFVPVGNPGPDYQQEHAPGSEPVHDLDGRAGRAHREAQLVVSAATQRRARLGRHRRSLFDAGGRKLVATAGKEGVLHVVDRDDGKLVFKLPMTTLLNHDVPLTPEGVRVCPVAGVQWNGPAFSPSTGPALRQRDRLVHGVQAGTGSEMGRDRALHGARERLGHERPDRQVVSGWINAVDPKTGKMAWRHQVARHRCTQR